ncbi:hypothetical protein ANT2_2365 [plant metagenome]|uniref:Uncharacterized protein n=1 Tax=plant metagenome TaxID=1297885 RepID=A0A484RI38_9ZZZZ
MKALKISLCCGLVGAILFGLIGLLSGGFGKFHWLAAAIVGLLLGLIAAPEFEPKAFRHAAWYQAGCGALAGGLVTAWLGLPASTCLMAAVIGGLIAWLAPWWLHHVQAP